MACAEKARNRKEVEEGKVLSGDDIMELVRLKRTNPEEYKETLKDIAEVLRDIGEIVDEVNEVNRIQKQNGNEFINKT